MSDTTTDLGPWRCNELRDSYRIPHLLNRWFGCVIGPAHPTDTFSGEELADKGFIGIYGGEARDAP